MKSSLEQERELSFKLLSEARTKKAGYDSQATRHKLSDSVTALCPTIKPYGWQIDVSEALALGLDATVIAGTGSGKTLPWAMPLLLEENRDRICLVISPLNELEADHARFFTKKLKIPAVAVNRDTWNAREGSIQNDVKEKHYRIILTSPEMCLGESGFARLLKEPRTVLITRGSKVILPPSAVDPPCDVRGGFNHFETAPASPSLCVRLVLADLVVGSMTANEFPQHNASRNPTTSILPSFRTCRTRFNV